MSYPILTEDWSDYDARKAKAGKDLSFFAVEESWEIAYLIEKIRKYKPFASAEEIRAAIAYCSRSIPGRKPRKAFVECVMDRL